jgi:hypothetical protein
MVAACVPVIALRRFSEPGSELASLLCFDRQDLTAFIITAGWTDRVRGNRASTLCAFIKLRRAPAVRRLACAQSHLRSLAFGNSHKGNQESRKPGKYKCRR